jgi:ATP-dependent DNA helicase RecG
VSLSAIGGEADIATHAAAAADEAARARLEILRQTNDGFRIAEEDLRLRGGGDLLGTKQSGEADFRLADLAAHETLLKTAAEGARQIAAADPVFTGPEGALARSSQLFHGVGGRYRICRIG